MFIGLISDTHALFDDNLKKFLTPVDEIWHAGDWGNPETVRSVEEFKPVRAVYGNCDGAEVRRCYPPVEIIEVQGLKILMTHIGGYPGRYDCKALQLIDAHRPDVFICGHSHILKVINDKRYDMLVINPGAAGIFGPHLVRTAVRFHIDGGRVRDLEVGEWPKP